MNRNIILSVHTPSGIKVCDLYDSTCQFAGQAANIKIQYNEEELTTLTFDLPRTIVGDDGSDIDNPKWDNIVDENLVYYTEDGETEVFVIHTITDGVQGFHKTCGVSCIQRGEELKRRGFSTSYESKSGTADEQLQATLKGSGWSVGEVSYFYEDGLYEKRISGFADIQTPDDATATSYIEISHAQGTSQWSDTNGWGNASIEIVSYPKNLCNGIIEKGRLNNQGDPVYEADATAYRSIDFTDVHLFAGSSLVTTGTNVGGSKLHFYNASKTLIQSATGSSVTVPANARYMKYEVYANAAGTATFVNPPAHIQIEKGTTGTEYKQYVSPSSIRIDSLGKYDTIERGVITRATVYDDETHTTSESETPIYENIAVYTARLYKGGSIFIRNSGTSGAEIVTAYTVNEEGEDTYPREKIRVMSKDAKTSTYDMIKEIGEQYGGYIVMHGMDRTVDLVTNIGVDSGICFDVKYNTRSIKRVRSSTDMITRLYNGHDGVSISSVNPLGVDYILDFGYYEANGMLTQEQKDAIDDFNEVVSSLSNELSVLYSARATIDNAVNNLIGRTPSGVANVTSASETSVVIANAAFYNNGLYPRAEDTVYLMGQDGVWKKYGVVGYSGGTNTIEVDHAIYQTGVYKAMWHSGVMPGAIGGKLIAVKTKEEIIDTVAEQLEAATDPTEIDALIARVEELEGELTDLYNGTATATGLNQMMAALYVYFDNAKAYDNVIAYDKQEIEAANEALEVALGGMLKDGVYEDMSYVAGQEDALYSDMVTYLSEHSVPQVEYSVDAMDRSAIEYEVRGRVRFGDIVYVTEHSMGIENMPARVIAYTDTPQDDKSNAFNIGNFGKKGEDMFQKILDGTKLIQAKVEKIDKAVVLDERGLIPPEIIEQSIIESDVGKEIDLQSNESLTNQDVSSINSFKDAVEEAVQNVLSSSLLNATTVDWSKIRELNLNVQSAAVTAAHTVVDPVSDRVTTVEATIEEIPEQIRLAVSEIDVGGLNLLADSDQIVKVASSDTTPVEIEFSLSGDVAAGDLLGKSIALSVDRMAVGDSIQMVPGDTHGDWFGVRAVWSWEDSTGTNAPTTTEWDDILLYNSSDASRPRVIKVLTAPEGYDELVDASVYIDCRRKPSASNLKTWSIGRPKLEIGTVATDWSFAPGELKNSSIVLNSDGISMSGGSITMDAGTMFRVQSGGAFQVDASSAEDSYINLGNGNFSASKQGGVVAERGDFSTEVRVAGSPVLTEATIPYKVVVSASQPEGNGIVWLVPQSSSGVTYTASTPGSRDNTIRYGAHMPPNAPITFQFTPLSEDTMTAQANYTYSMTFAVYSLSDVNNIGPFQFTVTLEKGGQSVTLTNSESYTFTKYSVNMVTVKYTGTTNMATTALPITAKFNAINNSGIRPDSTALSAIYLNSNQTISLDIKNDSASGSVHPCSIFYIP